MNTGPSSKKRWLDDSLSLKKKGRFDFDTFTMRDMLEKKRLAKEQTTEKHGMKLNSFFLFQSCHDFSVRDIFVHSFKLA